MSKKSEARAKILRENSEFLLKSGEWPGRIPERVHSTANALEMIWRKAGNTEYANIFARERETGGRSSKLHQEETQPF